MRMFGKLGWHGQCSCCNENEGKKAVKAEEERDWRRELAEEEAE